MKSTSLIVALAALEQKLDTILFARGDEEDHTGRNIAVAGAGTAAVGGGVLADRAVMKRYGQRGLLGTGEIQPGSPRSILGRVAGSGETFGGSAAIGRRAAYGAAASDIGQRASNVGRAARVAGRQAYRVTRDNGEGLVTAVGRGLRKAGKVAISKARAMSAGPDERVLALAARADELLSFDLTGGDHYLRHALGPIGVASTSRKGKRWDAFKESGADAAKNVAGGTTIGVGAGASIGAGIGALRLRRGVGKGPKMGAIGGAILGGGAGYIAGAVRGTHGKRQREIQERYHA